MTLQTNPAAETELCFPVEDWTVPQLNNLVRLLYGNQRILRRMMRSDALYIDRQLVERLKEAQTPADFEAELADGRAAEMLKGCRLREGKLTFETDPDDLDPTRRQAYVALLEAVLRHVKAARHVFFKADADPENEKYRANSLLTRLGFSGPEHKKLRRVQFAHRLVKQGAALGVRSQIPLHRVDAVECDIPNPVHPRAHVSVPSFAACRSRRSRAYFSRCARMPASFLNAA